MTTVTLPGGALHAAAAWAGRVIPSRPTTPVLAGLLLDATDEGDTGLGELALSGYDYDQRATATVTADVAAPGRVLVSGALLAAVAKTVPARTPVTLDCQRLVNLDPRSARET